MASKVLTPETTADRLGIGRTSLYRLRLNDPTFPKAVRLTERRIGFVEAEIDLWLDTRLAERDQQVAA
ncbi:MAG: AlpA family phage regulatory protein [Pseudomonadota bacterium]